MLGETISEFGLTTGPSTGRSPSAATLRVLAAMSMEASFLLASKGRALYISRSWVFHTAGVTPGETFFAFPRKFAAPPLALDT